MSDGTPLLPAPHAQTQAGNSKLTRNSIADFDRARKGAAERSAGNKGARASDRDGQRTNSTKVSLTENFDSELYGNGGGDKFAGYNTEIPVDDDMEVDGDDDEDANGGRLIGQYTATAEQIGEWATGEAAEDDILNSREKQAQIQNRETDYQRKRFQRRLSAGGEGKSYKESMQERDLEREEERVNRAIEDKKKDQIARGEDDMDVDEAKPTLKDGTREESPEAKPRRRARRRGWDAEETEPAGEIESNGNGTANGDSAEGEGKKRKSRWDTSSELKDGTSYNALGQLVDKNGKIIKEAEEAEAPKKKSRWDSTAAPAAINGESDAPKRRSKWDVAGPAGGSDATDTFTAGHALWNRCQQPECANLRRRAGRASSLRRIPDLGTASWL
jgi:splicing factor 3B subunit 1